GWLPDRHRDRDRPGSLRPGSRHREHRGREQRRRLRLGRSGCSGRREACLHRGQGRSSGPGRLHRRHTHARGPLHVRSRHAPAATERREDAVTALASLVEGLAAGRVRVIDLTQPLSEKTPILQLPPPFANTPGWTTHEISRYDERGPAWYWNWFEGGEHVGTHFDAPNHWITGRDREDVASVSTSRLVGPAVVIDKSREAAGDSDYLLSVHDVPALQAQHRPPPPSCWLRHRTCLGAPAADAEDLPKAGQAGPPSP